MRLTPAPLDGFAWRLAADEPNRWDDSATSSRVVDDNKKEGIVRIFGRPDINKLREAGNVKALLKALRYGKRSCSIDNWVLRRDAAEALGNIKDRQAVEPLVSALEDESIGVRLSAVRALGKIGDPRAVKPLFSILCTWDSDQKLRSCAAEALEAIGDQAIEFLASLRRDANRNVRYCAAQALAAIGGGFAVAEAAKSFSPMPPFRSATGNSQAVEPLIAVLQDPDVDLRDFAARVLGLIGGERAVEPLSRVLKDCKNSPPLLRRAAADALSRIGGPRAVRALTSHKEEFGSTVMPVIAKSLGRVGGRDVVDYLISLLELAPPSFPSDQSATARAAGVADWHHTMQATAIAVTEIRDPRAVDPLISLLKKISAPTGDDPYGLRLANTGVVCVYDPLSGKEWERANPQTQRCVMGCLKKLGWEISERDALS